MNTATPQENKQEGTAEKSFGVAAPSLSLPKGGGAIKGIGEKFAANPVTGTGSMTIPLPVSPGRSGFGPQLTLSYDSGAGNGPFGIGWNLSLPSITRKTDKGLPRYRDAEESDVFLLSGAEDLVPVLVQDGTAWSREQLPDCTVNGISFRIDRYRPRIEGLFARIERWSNLADRSRHPLALHFQGQHHHVVRSGRRTAASPIPPIRATSSAGSFAGPTTTRAT